MFRYLSVLVCSLSAVCVWADDLPTSPAQRYLSSGEFVEG